MSDRELFVIESMNESTGPDWVVEDPYRDLQLAKEQCQWLAGHWSKSRFRVVKYVPYDHALPSESKADG